MKLVYTKSLQWLAAIGALLILLSWVAQHGKLEWLSETLTGLGTGLVTAVAAVYGYDILTARRVDMERIVREKRATQALVVTVRQHFRMLLDCYRSAYDGPDEPKFADVNEFLGAQYQPVFQGLDIYAAAPINTLVATPYYSYIESSFGQLDRVLQSTLITSGQYLRQELFLAIRRVVDAQYMNICRSLSALCKVQIPIPGGRIPSQAVTGLTSLIEEYWVAFSQLLNAMEKCVPQGLREYRVEDWRNTLFPVGHARLADNAAAEWRSVPAENLSRTGFTVPASFFTQPKA